MGRSRMSRVASSAAAVVTLVVGCLIGAASPAASAGGTFACAADQVASTGGFTVSWADAPAGTWRFVIERNSYGSWEWRGRGGSSVASFADGPVGQRSIQVEYRVTALGADRSTLAVAPCLVRFASAFDCVAAYSSPSPSGGGESVVTWVPLEGESINYVISVKAASADRYWWYNRTEATSDHVPLQSDGLRPEVRVTARSNGAVVSSATCRRSEDAPPPQLTCHGRFDDQGGVAFASTLFLRPPAPWANGWVDWYRQTGRGAPWTKVASRSLLDPWLYESQVGVADPSLVLYRLEIWNLARTELLAKAVCDSGHDARS